MTGHCFGDGPCGAPNVRVNETVDKCGVTWREVDFVVAVGFVQDGDAIALADRRQATFEDFALAVAAQTERRPLSGIPTGNMVERQTAHQNVARRDIGGFHPADDRAEANVIGQARGDDLCALSLGSISVSVPGCRLGEEVLPQRAVAPADFDDAPVRPVADGIVGSPAD